MDDNELGLACGSQNAIARLSALETLRAELKTSSSSRWRDHTVANNLLSRVAWTLCDKNTEVASESFQFLLDFIPTCLAECEDVVEVAILPVVIHILGDAKLQMRRQALKVLDLYIRHANRIEGVMECLVHYGLESEDWRVRKESAAAIPILLTEAVRDIKWIPLVAALVGRLRDMSDAVIKGALAALKHIAQTRGEQELLATVGKLSGVSRQLFKQHQGKILQRDCISSGRRLKETHATNASTLSEPQRCAPPGNEAGSPDDTRDLAETPSLPSPPQSARTKSERASINVSGRDLRFGLFPKVLMDELETESDWRRRSMAIENLHRFIANLEDVTPLVLHLKEFVSFMALMLEDTNFKIALTSANIFGELIRRVGSQMGHVLGRTISCFVRKFGDIKLAMRQASAKLLLQLMRIVGPKPVVDYCLEYVMDDNAKVREETVNIVITALLTFSDVDWDFLSIVTPLRSTLKDPKPKVKYVTVEAYAVIASIIGCEKILELLRNLEVDKETLQLLTLRFKDPNLPQLNSEGLLEHIISRSSTSTPQPLSASPTRERIPSSTGAWSRLTPQSASTSPVQPFLSLHELGESETALQKHVRALDRALSASSQSELIDDGRKSRSQTARVKLPWERPRSNITNRYSFHGDLLHSDDSMEVARRARSFSDTETALTLEPSSGQAANNSSINYSNYVTSVERGLIIQGHVLANRRPSIDSDRTRPGELPEQRSNVEANLYLKQSDGKVEPSNVLRELECNVTERYSHRMQHNRSRTTSASWLKTYVEDRPQQNDDSPELGRQTIASEPNLPVLRQVASNMEFVDDRLENRTTTANMRDNRPNSFAARRVHSPVSEEAISPAAEGISTASHKHSDNTRAHPPDAEQESFAREDEDDDTVVRRASTSPRKKTTLKRRETDQTTLSAPPDLAHSKPVKSLEQEYRAALQQLRGHPDWEVKVQSLQTLNTILIESPSTLGGNLHEVLLAVIATVHNLRSAVSKHAIALLHDLYVHLGKAMDADLDATVGCLMKKVGEGSGFILEEADKALTAMALAVTPARAVAALLVSADHKNPAVRMRSACLLCKVFTSMTEAQASRYVQSYGDAGKLFTALVQLLKEGLAETRNAAKKIILFLSALPEFQRVLDKVLAVKQANEIRDAMKSTLSRTGSDIASPRRSPSKRSIKARDSRDLRDDRLAMIYRDMGSDDWRKRCQSIVDIVDFLKRNPTEISDRQSVQNLFDKYLERCRDANSKVSLLGLQSLQELIPTLKAGLDPVLHIIIQTLANQMATSNASIRDATAQAMDTLIAHADDGLVLQSLANIVQYGANSRVKPLVVEKMIPVVETCRSRPNIIAKHVIPTAVKLLKENKGEIKSTTARLMQGLFSLMGPSLFEQLGSHSIAPDVQSKLMVMLSYP